MRGIGHTLGLALALSALGASGSAAETALPTGTYRLEMQEVHAARFPILGRTRTTWASVSLAHLRRDGDALIQEHRLCDVRFESGLPLVEMVMPDAMRDSLVRPPYAVELVPADSGGWRYHADLGFEHVGYTPSAPGAPPPKRKSDPAIVDSDGDGKPGATLHLDVPALDPFELYVAQRGHAVLDGRVLEDGRVEGALDAKLEQNVIGSDPYFLKRNPKLEPEPELSRFALVPVPEDSTCDSLLDPSQERTTASGAPLSEEQASVEGDGPLSEGQNTTEGKALPSDEETTAGGAGTGPG